MNRTDIRLLQFVRGYPAISILLPTHRRRPENQQDPIRVKNLVSAAGERLLAEFPSGKGVNKSAYRDERARQFFRQVDAAYGQIAAGDEAPLVITGVDRNLAFFNEISAHTDQIIATLSGSYDKASAHELANLVWPFAQSGLARRRQKAFGELDAPSAPEGTLPALIKRGARRGKGVVKPCSSRKVFTTRRAWARMG